MADKKAVTGFFKSVWPRTWLLIPGISGSQIRFIRCQSSGESSVGNLNGPRKLDF